MSIYYINTFVGMWNRLWISLLSVHFSTLHTYYTSNSLCFHLPSVVTFVPCFHPLSLRFSLTSIRPIIKYFKHLTSSLFPTFDRNIIFSHALPNSLTSLDNFYSELLSEQPLRAAYMYPDSRRSRAKSPPPLLLLRASRPEAAHPGDCFGTPGNHAIYCP